MQLLIILFLISVLAVGILIASIPLTKYNSYQGIADEWDMNKLLKMYPNESSDN